jgi:hypothetical protein
LTGNGFPDLVDVDQSGLYQNIPGANFVNVDVYPNNGGYFASPPNSFPAGEGPNTGGYDVALGDFDGRHYANGKPILDLAVAETDGVGILMNDGSGGFGSPQINHGAFGYYVTVGDFTGNGKTDPLMTGGGAPGVLLGNGDGTFQIEQTISTDTSDAEKAVVGNFDGRHYANGLPILDVATIGGTGVNRGRLPRRRQARPGRR